MLVMEPLRNEAPKGTSKNTSATSSDSSSGRLELPSEVIAKHSDVASVISALADPLFDDSVADRASLEIDEGGLKKERRRSMISKRDSTKIVDDKKSTRKLSKDDRKKPERHLRKSIKGSPKESALEKESEEVPHLDDEKVNDYIEILGKRRAKKSEQKNESDDKLKQDISGKQMDDYKKHMVSIRRSNRKLKQYRPEGSDFLARWVKGE